MIKFSNAQSTAPIEIHHAALVFGVPRSNFGSQRTHWGSFHGIPQSSMQMLCWFYITTIHLTIIHKIHESQNIKTVKNLKEDPRYEMSVTEWF